MSQQVSICITAIQIPKNEPNRTERWRNLGACTGMHSIPPIPWFLHAFWASAQSILSLDGPYMNRLRAFASHNLSVLQRHFRSRPALKTMRVRERIKVSRSTPCKEASSKSSSMSACFNVSLPRQWEGCEGRHNHPKCLIVVQRFAPAQGRP